MDTLSSLTYTEEPCGALCLCCVDYRAYCALSMVPMDDRGTPVVAVPANRASVDSAGPRDTTLSAKPHEDHREAEMERRDDLQSTAVVDTPWQDIDTSPAPLKPEGGAGSGWASMSMGRDGYIGKGEGGGGLRRGSSAEAGETVPQTRHLPQGRKSSAGHHRLEGNAANSGSGMEQPTTGRCLRLRQWNRQRMFQPTEAKRRRTRGPDSKGT